MSAMQQIELLMKELSKVEKMQLLQAVRKDLDDAFPGIEKTPGVCGGNARIAGWRIPVWLLVEAQRDGASDRNLLESYPFLHQEDLTNAWEYARAHPDEIEAQIRENSEENIERLIAEHIAEDKNAAALYR